MSASSWIRAAAASSVRSRCCITPDIGVWSPSRRASPHERTLSNTRAEGRCISSRQCSVAATRSRIENVLTWKSCWPCSGGGIIQIQVVAQFKVLAGQLEDGWAWGGMRKLATVGILLVAILDLVGAARVAHWLAPQTSVTVLRGSASANNMDFSQVLKALGKTGLWLGSAASECVFGFGPGLLCPQNKCRRSAPSAAWRTGGAHGFTRPTAATWSKRRLALSLRIRGTGRAPWGLAPWPEGWARAAAEIPAWAAPHVGRRRNRSWRSRPAQDPRSVPSTGAAFRSPFPECSMNARGLGQQRSRPHSVSSPFLSDHSSERVWCLRGAVSSISRPIEIASQTEQPRLDGSGRHPLCCPARFSGLSAIIFRRQRWRVSGQVHGAAG